jgi:hypothetical protein
VTVAVWGAWLGLAAMLTVPFAMGEWRRWRDARELDRRLDDELAHVDDWQRFRQALRIVTEVRR